MRSENVVTHIYTNIYCNVTIYTYVQLSATASVQLLCPLTTSAHCGYVLPRTLKSHFNEYKTILDVFHQICTVVSKIQEWTPYFHTKLNVASYDVIAFDMSWAPKEFLL